ncbi:CLUMA_CG019347, isoform A [Clunio marinus]|uniref:CLUMA_CG019347, isoform A n=1 Tax=Clunio marinus TaxID=568069 RepID=A0A1J1J1V7_9DIPT|nr:CLUMA_CG019347, isoform A [Clunio marinus]
MFKRHAQDFLCWNCSLKQWKKEKRLVPIISCKYSTAIRMDEIASQELSATTIRTSKTENNAINLASFTVLHAEKQLLMLDFFGSFIMSK